MENTALYQLCMMVETLKGSVPEPQDVHNLADLIRTIGEGFKPKRVTRQEVNGTYEYKGKQFRFVVTPDFLGGFFVQMENTTPDGIPLVYEAGKALYEALEQDVLLVDNVGWIRVSIEQ